MPPRGGGGRTARRRILMELVDANSSTLSVVSSCHALGVSRATYYRWWSPKYGPHPARKVSPNAVCRRDAACAFYSTESAIL